MAAPSVCPSVPPHVPVLLESCFGHLRNQTFMAPYAHLMQVFSHCMHQGGVGFEKATCIWLSCFAELEGPGLTMLRGIFAICGLGGCCVLPGGAPGRLPGGRHKQRLGRDQSHPLHAQELLPPGFTFLMLAWLLEHGPAAHAAGTAGGRFLLCLFEGRHGLDGMPEGSWRAPCMAAGVWHIAVADNLETMVDFERKIVQIRFDLGPTFEIGKLLQEVYSLSGLQPAGLVGVCCSPPCKTYSRLDQTNNCYRDHHMPSHPAKQPGSTNYKPAMAEVAHHADNTVGNLLRQLPGLGLAGMEASSPFFGQTE